MSQKIFDNDLVIMCKNKVTLKLNKTTIYWDVYNRLEYIIDVQVPL